MNVLFLTTNYPDQTGGIATLAREEAEGLAELGHQVRVLAYTGSPKRQAEKSPNLHVTWHGALNRPILRLLPLIGLTLLETFRKRWDVIYSPTYRGFGIPVMVAAKFRRLPYALYVHGTELNTEFRTQSRSQVFNHVATSASALLVNSQSTADLLSTRIRGMSPPIEILTPGVNLERFYTPDPRAVDLVRTRWLSHLPSLKSAGNPVLLLTVSRLTRQKGLDLLLQAVAGLRERNLHHCGLILAGEGPERQYLEDLASSLNILDRVHFAGRVHETELLASYGACDIFLQPSQPYESYIEGFGISLLEAQAVGKPCIATNWGGIPEAVQHGLSAILVPTGSSEAILNAIETLASDPARRQMMGNCGRDWASRNTWSTHASRLAEILSSFKKSKNLK